MGEKAARSGYTLMLCEKPDASSRLAEALAEGEVKTIMVEGVRSYQFSRGGGKIIVCSALGHLYGISDAFRNRGVYPVFDVEWFPTHSVNKKNLSKNRVEAIRTLALGAKTFVNACDFDTEGETIGYNLLKYACGNKEDTALRAKFSTLTRSELVSAFEEAKSGTGKGLAKAGRTRHVIDFLWGVNLSRALTQSLLPRTYRYRTVSIGRVQGPTLAFVAEREIEIRTFVPTPYWAVTGTFLKDEERFEASYGVRKVRRKTDAESVKRDCEGKDATVSEVTHSVFKEGPPFPFNTGELQREAYRAFGFPPIRTLQLAERLYLAALISYPRTNSQKIPRSVDWRRIIENLGRIHDYANYSQELLKKELRPHEGEKNDFAHPSIYPTGEYPDRNLGTWERRLLDLIIRRFIANFADDVVRERVLAQLAVGGHRFTLAGRRTIEEGWMRYYRSFIDVGDILIPSVAEGDALKVVGVDYQEKVESPVERYNQASLLERMEKEEIGTKATRAETISTLISRGYVSESAITATELGLSVIETMRRYSSEIVSTVLTRQIERHLEAIESGGEAESRVVEEVIFTLSSHLAEIKRNEDSIGRTISRSIPVTSFERTVLGACPVCKTGKLTVIRSSKTHKRFVGCTNYPNVCRASAPLPQRGRIKVTSKPCRYCVWPVILVLRTRRPWRLCINTNCPSKSGKKRELQTLWKRS